MHSLTLDLNILMSASAMVNEIMDEIMDEHHNLIEGVILRYICMERNTEIVTSFLFRGRTATPHRFSCFFT